MIRYILLIIAVLSIGSHSAAKNKILVAGSGNPNILLIDKETGNIDWTHSLEVGQECNAVVLTPDGNILYSYSKGAKIVDWDHNVIWDYTVPSGQELQSVSTLKNGRILLGICGNPAQLIEIDAKGNTTNQIKFDLNIESPHSQFRQVRQSKNNNYLVPILGEKKLIELNRYGDIVAEVSLPGGPFSSFELKNGNLIIPCGDSQLFVEVDRKTGKEVKRITSKELSQIMLLFVAEISQLKNGNLMIANWNGHSKGEINNAPQLFEIDSHQHTVWKLSNHSDIVKISAFYNLDKKEISRLKRGYSIK